MQYSLNSRTKLIGLVVVLALAALACGTSTGDGGLSATAAALQATAEALSSSPTQPPAPPTNPPPPTNQPPPTSAPLPPAATSAPAGPEGLIYSTDFSDTDNWYAIYVNDNTSRYTVQSRSNGLYVYVPDSQDGVWIYNEGLGSASDVQIEANVELVGGTNYTYIELICRSSDIGEYIFYLDAGGFWQIGLWEFEGGAKFTQLAYGGSTAIKVAKAPNFMVAVCDGNQLILVINGTEVGRVTNNRLSSGLVGIGVETFDNPISEVIFHDLEIWVP